MNKYIQIANNILLVKIQCIVGASLNINASRTNACMREEIHAHNNDELY